MTSVKLPASLRKIGIGAFRESGLVSVYLPADIEYIGANAFYACRQLTAVFSPGKNSSKTGKMDEEAELPSSISVLEGWAFIECSSLKKIKLGSNLSKLGDYALETNYNVESITFSGTIPPEFGFKCLPAFDGLGIFVPSGCRDSYIGKLNLSA